MKTTLHWFLLILFLSFNFQLYAQDVALYKQFNGAYDFVFVGNTMNPGENNFRGFCEVNTTSAAQLTLTPGDEIEKAYLYWAGSGTGDLDVTLNGTPLSSDRTFSYTHFGSDFIRRPFFSAFADVTGLVKSTGSGTYTLSDLDVNASIRLYCTNATNFAGWAIVVVYKNPSLPLFQLNIYDGLQGVPDELNINLDNLNVVDTNNSQIGFIAWEGDQSLDFGERLTVNDSIISNPPLNPETNAFNGTNSSTGSDTLYNMDLDVYNVQNSIRVGDRSARIKLTSERDFVMINTVVTKLSSLLPDATIGIDKLSLKCDSRKLDVDYTVFNLNATAEIRPGTPIAFYANGYLLFQTQTTQAIQPGESSSSHFSTTIPDAVPDRFAVTIAVDDDGTGTGILAEINEDNNDFTQAVRFGTLPQYNILPDLFSCNEGLKIGTFDFSDYEDAVKVQHSDEVTFHENLTDAENKNNPILNVSNYQASGKTEIFVRIQNEYCYATTSFFLNTKNCPPRVYNYISANHDGANDDFFIDGLRNVFMDFKLSVFNRWGKLLWSGGNNSPDWDGDAVKGFVLTDGKVPDGTYFYVLELNDPDFPKPLTGFLYFKK